MTNSRSLFRGSGSTVGVGKAEFARKYFKDQQRDALKKENELKKLRSLYHPPVKKPKKQATPKQYKSEVINPKVLAKISNVDVEKVEKALKGFLGENLKEIVLNGVEMVTLDSVLKTIKEVQEKAKDEKKKEIAAAAKAKKEEAAAIKAKEEEAAMKYARLEARLIELEAKEAARKEEEQVRKACVTTADPLPIDGIWQNEGPNNS